MGKFDTTLTSNEELKFKQWKAKYAPDDSGYDYDLRGAFKEGLTPDSKTGHLSDKYKKPNHPTFSNESIYATKENKQQAGHWKGNKYISPILGTTKNIKRK